MFRHIQTNIGLYILGIIFLVITIPYLDFVPFWDGGINYTCLANAVEKPFRITNFRCANHVAYAYLLLLSIGQYIDFGNIALVHLTNMILAFVSMLAIYKTLRHIFPDHKYRTNQCLMSGLFLLSPLFISNLFHLNLDFAITCFFTIYIYFLTKKQYWIANIAAIAMIFSKETGIVIYTATVGLYSIMFLLHLTRQSIRSIVKLVLPGIIATAYWYYHLFIGKLGVQSNVAEGANNTLKHALDFDVFDKGLQSYLIDIFVLNFTWIITCIIVAALITMLTRTIFRSSHNIFTKEQSQYAIFFFLLLIATVYLTTRYRPFNNPRYILVTYPTLFITGYCALQTVIRSKKLQAALLSVTTILFITSIYRTIDPLSKKFFSTFYFGDHTMLLMTRFIGHINQRRDEMVYNMEFTALHYLTSDIFQEIKPMENDTVFIGDWGAFGYPTAIHRKTFEHTADIREKQHFYINEDSFSFRLENINDFKYMPIITYIDFPLFSAGDRINNMKKTYPLISEKTFDFNGYKASLLTFDTNPL